MLLLRHGQSLFNAAFTATRVDPGIPDPELTALGRDQARDAARALEAARIARIIVSPYTRALETAAIVAEELRLPVQVVNPVVRERYAFACDIGSPASTLAAAWPGLDFSALPEIWWPEAEEPAESIERRAREFRAAMADDAAWQETLVVSHWGFILALTGERATNGQVLRCDPTGPHPGRIVWRH